MLNIKIYIVFHILKMITIVLFCVGELLIAGTWSCVLFQKWCLFKSLEVNVLIQGQFRCFVVSSCLYHIRMGEEIKKNLTEWDIEPTCVVQGLKTYLFKITCSLKNWLRTKPSVLRTLTSVISQYPHFPLWSIRKENIYHCNILKM